MPENYLTHSLTLILSLMGLSALTITMEIIDGVYLQCSSL